MLREAARRKQDNVHTQVLSVPGILMRDCLGSRSDTTKAEFVDRQVEVAPPPAPLNLDECDRSRTPDYKVDLTQRSFPPAGKNPPTLRTQE